MHSSSDSKLTFIKIARVLTWLVYAYVIFATVFLVLGFILLLFGANPAAGFAHFVYTIAGRFLQPFREIFPGQQLGDRSYFSAAGLFAIIIYGIIAACLHSLITFITLKQTQHQVELDALLTHDEDATSEIRRETTTAHYRKSAPRSRRVV